jgi:hypothetical protein
LGYCGVEIWRGYRFGTIGTRYALAGHGGVKFQDQIAYGTIDANHDLLDVLGKNLPSNAKMIFDGGNPVLQRFETRHQGG